jgi:hypothetical protein
VLSGQLEHALVLGGRREVRRHFDLADRSPLENTRQATRVVCMEMSEHDDRHVLHVKLTQAPIDGCGVGAGVYDYRSTATSV